VGGAEAVTASTFSLLAVFKATRMEVRLGAGGTTWLEADMVKEVKKTKAW
jgi:hypothetical protein